MKKYFPPLSLWIFAILLLVAYPKLYAQSQKEDSPSPENVMILEKIEKSIKRDKSKRLTMLTAKGDTLFSQWITRLDFQKRTSIIDPVVLQVMTLANEQTDVAEDSERAHTIFLTFDEAVTSPKSLASGATLWKWSNANLTFNGIRLVGFSPYVQVVYNKHIPPLSTATVAVPLGDTVQITFK